MPGRIPLAPISSGVWMGEGGGEGEGGGQWNGHRPQVSSADLVPQILRITTDSVSHRLLLILLTAADARTAEEGESWAGTVAPVVGDMVDGR